MREELREARGEGRKMPLIAPVTAGTRQASRPSPLATRP